jgi:hypothetical protein
MAHHAYLLSVPAKIWPHVRATLAAGPAHKPRLDIGQPDNLGPAIAADRD